MEMLFFMLPFMFAFALAFLGLFLWAVRSSQYEDLEGEKHRIFFEDRPAPRP